MEDVAKLRVVLEDLVEEFRGMVEDRRSFTEPREYPRALQVADEAEKIVRQVQTASRRWLHLEDIRVQSVPPFREALQIVVGTAAEALDEVEELRHHVMRFLTQSQLQKGLTRLLDWTSDLDYAVDRVRVITRRLQKIVVQLERVESLTN